MGSLICEQRYGWSEAAADGDPGKQANESGQQDDRCNLKTVHVEAPDHSISVYRAALYRSQQPVFRHKRGQIETQISHHGKTEGGEARCHSRQPDARARAKRQRDGRERQCYEPKAYL